MQDEVVLDQAEAAKLATRACLAAGAKEATARSLVNTTLSAALYGPSTLGFPYLVDYLNSFREGRINCDATPTSERPYPAFVVSDADRGIAQLGFDLAFDQLVETVRTFGVAVFTQTNSYTAGELGYYVRRLAQDGIVGLAATNANALMVAKPGGPAVYRIVRNMLRSYVDYRPMECWTLGSECDGAFAQYAKAPARETYKVECEWTDVELASVSCAYSTAENLLHRAGVVAGEHVVITGASGGVGSAAIQLAKRRGAVVTAVAAKTTADQMVALGADRVHPRGESILKGIGRETVDVVIDVAAGPDFTELLDVLKKGGRYAVAGAIAGPIVELDVRTLYLKDLTFLGCTFQEDVVFENLVTYIERGEIRPVVGKTYPLKDIVQA